MPQDFISFMMGNIYIYIYIYKAKETSCLKLDKSAEVPGS